MRTILPPTAADVVVVVVAEVVVSVTVVGAVGNGVLLQARPSPAVVTAAARIVVEMNIRFMSG